MAVQLVHAVYQQVMVRLCAQGRMHHLPHLSSHLGYPVRLNPSMHQRSLLCSRGIS